MDMLLDNIGNLFPDGTNLNFSEGKWAPLTEGGLN